MIDLTVKRPMPAPVSTRQVRRRETEAIHRIFTGEDEEKVIRAMIQKAASGSVKHAEFLFNRKYGLPVAQTFTDSVHRVFVVGEDPSFGGLSDEERAERLLAANDTDENDILELTPEEAAFAERSP